MKQAYSTEIYYLHDGGYFYAFHTDFGFSACSATGDSIDEAIASLQNVRASLIEYLKKKDNG